MYWVLLPLIRSDISYFSWPYESGPLVSFCTAFKMLRQFIMFLIFLLIIFYTDFLIFDCHLSGLTSFIFQGIKPVHYMTKIFKFADFGQSFQRVLGHNFVSHDAFILLTVHEIMSFLSAFLCTHTALLERLLFTVVYLCVGWNFQMCYDFCQICLWWFVQAYSFLGLFIGVAVTGDENHQKRLVGYCADIFNNWEDVYFFHSVHYFTLH